MLFHSSTVLHSSSFCRHAGRRVACLALLSVAAGGAHAQVPSPAPATAATPTVVDIPDSRGFSYFMGLGRQRLTYREQPSTAPAESRARVDNPLLVSGAVYAISEHSLLALDAETTFAPRSSTERWNATGPTFNGSPVTDVLQTNRFSLQESNTRLLYHHRVQGPVFGLIGPSFHTQSFKRLDFRIGADNLVSLPADRTVEESMSEVLLHAGVGLESERVRGSAHHYSVRVLVGVPVWRRVDNTLHPGVTFDGTRGLDVGVAGRYSWAVRPHVHVGLWGQWSRATRKSQVVGNLELPKSTLDNTSAGLELLWKL